jgi:hypothetical protein
MAEMPPPAMMHTFYGEPVTREVRDQVTIALNLPGSTRKLFKMLFRTATPDIYVQLPYLKVNYFRCGLVRTTNEIPHEIANGIDIHDISAPVKLSYHESGQVHFKATSNDVAARLPLTVVQSTPIASFNGDHIFTIELDGILNFAEAKDRDRKRPGFFAYDVPDDIQRYKVIAFAGFSDDIVSGKLIAADGAKLKPTSVLAFRRMQYRVPLYLGLYMQYGPSLQLERRGSAYELMLGGFNSDETAGEYIFMHARI